MKNLSNRDLLQLLQSSIAGEPDKVPEGCKTAKQWAVTWGKSNQQTRYLLDHGLRKGLIERVSYRTLTPAGVIRPVPHYKQK